MSTIEKVINYLTVQFPILEDNTGEYTISYFHTEEIPKISILNYLKRLAHYTQCSEGCLISTLIYIDRVQANNKSFIVNQHSIHRLFLTALVLSLKFLEDKYFKNSVYAQVGGIYLDEINLLEKQLLILLEYRLVISPAEYDKYSKLLDN